MFWQYQSLNDALYLVALLGWGIILIVLRIAPGLMGQVWTSYRYGRSESVGAYVQRFIPLGVFVQLIDLGRSLLISLITLVWASERQILPSDWLIGYRLLSYILIASVVLWLINILRRWSYGLWSYIFMNREASRRLEQDYINISLLGSVFLMPVALLALSPVASWLSIYFLAGIVCLSAILRIVQALGRLVGHSEGYVYLFLYLCTQELLPWCLLAGAITYGLS